jgi:serine phosphatase RsbU (regulator of sigma subunit)
MRQVASDTENYTSLGQVEAHNLLRAAPVVGPDNTNLEVLDLFSENNELIGLPVIENGIPIGIINRHIFMNAFAKAFHREIFGKKSCIAFMDKDPLIVDHRTGIQALSGKVIEVGKKALTDGFIITENTRYVGVGVGYDLIRVVAKLHAEKNQALIDSISYASVIQRSMLGTSTTAMDETLKEYFLYWQPRDLVGGDFFHFARFPDGYFVAIMDCTGHGVPGAFITLIMSSALNRALLDEKLYSDPAAVLMFVNQTVKRQLSQFHETGYAMEGAMVKSDDGMDVAACWVDRQAGLVTFAGSRIPLFYLYEDDPKTQRIDGDRKGVGYAETPIDYQWKNQSIPMRDDKLLLYVATDGIFDQIGGNKEISFGKRRVQQLITEHYQHPFKAQEQYFIEAFTRYKGRQNQRDDVSLFGWRA